MSGYFSWREFYMTRKYNPSTGPGHEQQASMVSQAVAHFLACGGKVSVLPSNEPKPLPLRRDTLDEPAFFCPEQQTLYRQRAQEQMHKQRAFQKRAQRALFESLPPSTIESVINLAVNERLGISDIARRVRHASPIVAAILDFHAIKTCPRRYTRD